MIQCPSCGKDIADDSAHCGYCGEKIETGAGKKTMMGFAALTGDQLQKAAEEARRARQDAGDPQQPQQPVTQQPAAQQPQHQPAPQKPGLSLPQRPTKQAAGNDRPKLPNIPRPSTTPTAGTPASPPQIGGKLGGASDLHDDGTSSDAKTAVMPSVGEAPSTIDEEAIGGPDFAADTSPDGLDAPQTVPVSPMAEDTLPESDALDSGPSGPTEFGGAPMSEGPTEFGSAGNLQVAENTLPEKKKNPALIIVGVLAVFAFMCCLFWTAYSFLLPIILG